MRLDLQIFVRTKDDNSLQAFEDAGATEIVPEILEGSIMLASHLLFALGVSTNKIVNQIKRNHITRYEMLRHLYKGKEEIYWLEEDEKTRRSLQTIVVPEQSIAANQTIETFFPELPLESSVSTYTLKSIIRKGKRYENPLPNTTLLEQDVLVVLATSEEKTILEQKIIKEL
jgi:CPA2 family monovalent cation:H+ antiporter-2